MADPKVGKRGSPHVGTRKEVLTGPLLGFSGRRYSPILHTLFLPLGPEGALWVQGQDRHYSPGRDEVISYQRGSGELTPRVDTCSRRRRVTSRSVTTSPVRPGVVRPPPHPPDLAVDGGGVSRETRTDRAPGRARVGGRRSTVSPRTRPSSSRRTAGPRTGVRDDRDYGGGWWWDRERKRGAGLGWREGTRTNPG